MSLKAVLNVSHILNKQYVDITVFKNVFRCRQGAIVGSNSCKIYFLIFTFY